jgi:hypothetical protein
MTSIFHAARRLSPVEWGLLVGSLFLLLMIGVEVSQLPRVW